MDKKRRRRRDLHTVAYSIYRQAIGEEPKRSPPERDAPKKPEKPKERAGPETG